MGDWEKTTIGETFSFLKTASFPRSQTTMQSNNFIYLHYGDIHKINSPFLDLDKHFLYSLQEGIDASNFDYLQNGDLIIVDASEDYEGIASCVEIKNLNGIMISGLHTFALRSKNQKIAKGYAAFVLKHPITAQSLKKIATGISVLGISKTNVAKINIFLPSLPEQKAIADILQTWDTAIEKIETLIDAKEHQFGWFCQKLIIDNGKLKTERLGNISSMNSGGTPKSTIEEYYGGYIPWVSIADMTKKGMWINSTQKTLTNKGLNSCSARIYPKNTVLYAMYASIGECSIASVELSSSQAILGITPDTKKLYFEYLYYYLTSLKDKIKLQGQWGTQPNLNTGIVKNFRIPLPNFSEQKRIAHILNTARREIDSLKQLSNEYQTQKRGLMQKLLTGKWKVKG